MKIKAVVLLVPVILLIIFWQWLLPGDRVSVDFPKVADSQLIKQLDLPRMWAQKDVEGLGQYSGFTLWSWPFTFVSGLFATLGLGFALQERLFWIIPCLLIGILGIWQICKQLNLSVYAQILACLFYLTNTYILLLIDGGQLSIALAYAWMPIAFMAIKKSINGSAREKIIAGLAVWVIGIFDIRVIYTLFLLVLIDFLYSMLLIKEDRLQLVLGYIKTSLFCLFIVIGLNVYWLYPYILNPISKITYQSLTQNNFQPFSSLGHGLLLLAPHWYKNVFGNISQLQFIFIIIPLFVFLAPVLKPKKKAVGFWLLVGLIGIFLAKGSAEPFPAVYQWLFVNIPGFSLFRDSSKFFFLIGLSFTVLFAITIDEILKTINRFPKAGLLFFVFLIGYIFILTGPVLKGEMTGTFSKPAFEKEYTALTALFEKDQTFSRILWIPSKAPLGYFSSTHPSIEALRIVQKRPFGIGTRGAYEILNFLREAPYMSEIFDVTGIGFIVYPFLDPRRDNLSFDNTRYFNTFLDQLSNLPWLSREEHSTIPLLRVKNHQDRFFITPNLWWVIGSDDLYQESTKSSSLKLSKNALLFVEEVAQLGSKIDEFPDSKIVLNNKNLNDLAASFIPSSQIIFPAAQLKNDPDQSGWWKKDGSDLIKWRDFLQTKYAIDSQDFDLGGGWAVGEGSLKLRMKNENFKKGRVLLVRALESSRSGNLDFYQDNNLVGKINTKKENTNVRWFEIGKLMTNGDLLIRSEGDINIVNAVAILDANIWLDYQTKARNLNQAGRILQFNQKNISSSSARVSYQEINPTQFRVAVSNLKEPAFLIFSESFDPGWYLGDQQAVPVYSLLNGFRIQKDGAYVLRFKPQDRVYPGLAISALTLIIIFAALIWTRKRIL